jgi:hypothetical protein
MWLGLVERYSRLVKSTTPSKDFINLLQVFIEKRSNDEFKDQETPSPTQSLNQHLFGSDSPDIHEMLCHAAYFDKSALTENIAKEMVCRCCPFETLLTAGFPNK